jgi:hypothetical protein
MEPADPDLVDDHPALPLGAEPWLKCVNVYLRRLSIKGERLDEAEDDEPVRLPRRSGGARLGV